MGNIILFRFDREFDICKERLKLIRHFNPDMEIYGLYGGDLKELQRCKRILGDWFSNIYVIPIKSKDWKWKNSDLAVLMWYRKIGMKLDFDRLYFIEWDLVIFGSLDKIYRHIPLNCIGITALTLLKNVEDKWDWITDEPEKGEWKKLLSYAKSKFGYKREPYASLGPGTCFPREFLDKYSRLEIPQLCHDELRLPLFAQILGFDVRDTGFYKNWFDKKESNFFNCIPKEISFKTIIKELAKKNGRRAFHPFRKTVNLEEWFPTHF